MGKEAANKEEEAGREPVYLVPDADHVVKKYSLTVAQLHGQAVQALPHKEQNISLMV